MYAAHLASGSRKLTNLQQQMHRVFFLLFFCFFLLDALGVSPLKIFVEKCVARGYAIRVLQLHHEEWVEVFRKRIFIIGCGQKIGHAEAADWIVRAICSSREYRLLSPPVPVFSVVATESLDERVRRDGAQASQ